MHVPQREKQKHYSPFYDPDKVCVCPEGQGWWAQQLLSHVFSRGKRVWRPEASPIELSINSCSRLEYLWTNEVWVHPWSRGGALWVSQATLTWKIDTALYIFLYRNIYSIFEFFWMRYLMQNVSLQTPAFWNNCYFEMFTAGTYTKKSAILAGLLILE